MSSGLLRILILGFLLLMVTLTGEELPGLTKRQQGTVVETIRSGTLSWPETPEVAPGGDMRLPAWLPESNPCGGFYQLWGRSTDPRLAALVELAALPEITWADIEPEPGVFRFDLLEQGTKNRVGLTELRKQGRRGIVWFMAWRDGDVPAWAIRRHGLTVATVDEHGGAFRLLPVWRPGPRADLLKAMAALGDRLRNEPACGAMYLPTLGNASGECYPSRALLAGMEAIGDRADGTWLDFHLDMLHTWAEHLGPEKGVWLSIDAPFDGRHRSEDADRQERTAYSRLIDEVLRLGFSSRSGGTDSLTNHLANGWLLEHDEDGRTRSRHLPLRFWGNETEEFLAPCFPYFEAMVDAGVAQGFTHYLFDDALVLRLAGDPTSTAVFDQRYAAVLEHLHRTAGWPPEMAPEAVVMLGEQDVRDDRIFDRKHPWPQAAGIIRKTVNQGWCLEQLEADGARTAPALRREWRLDESDLTALREAYERLARAVPECRGRRMLADVTGVDANGATEAFCHGILGMTLKDGVTHTWGGRRTRRDEGQNRIRFHIDPRFLAAGSQRVVIQATVRADGLPWSLRLPGSSAGEDVSLAAPRMPADGRLCTVTFGVPALRAGVKGADFIFERTTGADLVVQRVRVVRWTAPPEVLAGSQAIAARRAALWTTRHDDEVRAIEAAAQQHRIRVTQIAAVNQNRVATLRARLNKIHQAAEGNPGRALANAAEQGLDLMTLRQRYDQAMEWTLIDDPRAAAAVAQLETLIH